MEGWLADISLWLTAFLTWVEESYEKRKGLVAISGLILTFLAWRRPWRAKKNGAENRQAASTTLTSVQRRDLLDRVQHDHIAPRLYQELRKTIRLDLGLTDASHAIPRRLTSYPENESGGGEPIVRTISEIFESPGTGGRLLILGEPGTGKSNLLLELAEKLIKAAREDESLQIPIVFSLPSWTLVADRSLSDWMQHDLASQELYGLSRAAARFLIEEDLILPLFDGLDEVAETSRAACVAAIHNFQIERPLGRNSRLAICCRAKEYDELPEKLKLAKAVHVQKLTREEVEFEVSQPGMEQVRAALDKDPELLTIVDTPLWMHLLYGAAQADPDATIRNRTSRDRLYLRYVKYALGRDDRGSSRPKTDGRRLLNWLGWIAFQMQVKGQSQFAFESLDNSWLPTARTRQIESVLLVFVNCLIYGLAGGVVFGLVVGRILGIAIGLIVGLLSGAVLGLVVGMAVVLFSGLKSDQDRDRDPFGVPQFQPGRWRPALGAGLAMAVFAGLLFGVIQRPTIGLLFGPMFGVVVTAYFWLDSALRPRPVAAGKAPNNGTVLSFAYAAMIVGPTIVLSVGGAWGIREIMLPDHLLGPLTLTLASVGGCAVVLGFDKGGHFALRHYVVRLLLWRRGLAPLRYVRFLNECTDRLFLIRRGGNYEFFHITFRDFMAKEYGPKE